MTINDLVNHKYYDLELWHFMYDNYPYLEGCDTDFLQTRFDEISGNIKLLAGVLEYGLSHNDKFSIWWWFNKLEDIKYELSKRSIYLELDFNMDLNFPHKALLHYSKKCFYGNITPREVFRYTSKEYALKFLDTGYFRLTHAVEYAKMDDVARKDDETEKAYYTPTKGVTITNYSTGKTFEPGGAYMKYANKINDYYLLSLSSDFDLRLAQEFGCNCVLHIKDFSTFVNRVKTRLHRYYTISECACMYYDEYNCGEEKNYSASQLKDIIFAYQREVRLCALPLAATQNNDPFINVYVNSLRDIAQGFEIQIDGKLKEI